jgi:hypothetical protein
LEYQVRTTRIGVIPRWGSLTGELRACSRGKAGGMIMNAKLLLQFSADRKKIRPELLPLAAADRTVGVRLMETRSTREDEKLSTETGQLRTFHPVR